MNRLARQHPSAALVVACIALFAALGGGAYAAGKIHGSQLVKNTVGTKALTNGGVKPKDVQKNSLGGSRINESKLGKVPSAASADTAQNAQNAVNAQNADQLDGVESGEFLRTGQRVYVSRLAEATDVPHLDTFAHLLLPAGQYQVTAKLVYDNDDAGASEDHCDMLLPGPGNNDQTAFTVGGNGSDSDIVPVSFVGAIASTTGGLVSLRCAADGADDVHDIAIVATRLD